jgi:aspartate/methionine/tyrosine aminotransferase
LRVAPEQLLITPGTTGALSITAAALFLAGSTVAVETPSYEPLRVLPLREGARVVEVLRERSRGWRLDPDAVGKALRGAARGHVLLTSPHNPSGARSSRADLEALASVAAGSGGYLVCNEIYEEFVDPAERFHAAVHLPNAISLGSLTKAYGLGCLRIGWVLLGSAAMAEREVFEDASFLQYVDLPTPALRAATRALGLERELLAPYGTVRTESRPLLARWLASERRVEAQLPEHGIIAFAAVPSAPDTRALAEHLAAREQLAVVPGEHFGAPGHLRIGFGSPAPALADALTRLSRGLDSFAGA